MKRKAQREGLDAANAQRSISQPRPVHRKTHSMNKLRWALSYPTSTYFTDHNH